LGQIDDLDLAGGEFLRQLGESAQVESSFSNAFGLSRHLASHSCATSPGYTSSTPSRSALTTAVASAAGATFGGGRSWFHSSSSGPGKTLITRTPAGRISARRHCASECAAALEAENVPCGGKLASA